MNTWARFNGGFEAFSGFFEGMPRLCSCNAAALMPRNGPETLLPVFLCTMPRHGISLQRHAAALNKGFYTDCVFGTFWLCFGLGLVLGLWYLDFKLGISIVWV